MNFFSKNNVKLSNLEEIFDKFGVKVLADNYGPIIYKGDDESTVFMKLSVEMHGIHTIKPFAETFQSGLDIELNDKKNEKKKLCLELYNVSQFESTRIKFLTLIIAIESLLEETLRDDKAVKLIESLVKQTKEHTELEKNDIDSLSSCLGKLKNESISYRAKSLIKIHLKTKEYNGKSGDNFFIDCYKIRGDIMHKGNPFNKIGDFNKITDELDKMVSDLLISCIEND